MRLKTSTESNRSRITSQSETYLWCSAGFDCNYVRHYARHYSRCFPFGNYGSLWKWHGSTVMYVWDSYHVLLIPLQSNRPVNHIPIINNHYLHKSNHIILSLSISAYERHMAVKSIETVANVWNPKHISLRINGVPRISHRCKQGSNS